MNGIFSEISLNQYIYLSLILFCIGLFGVLFRRNAIVLLMCIELMLNSVNLLFVSFSSFLGDSAGQLFVFFIMVVAAAEAAVGLAILVMMYRNTRNVDVSFLDNLKG